MLNIPDNIKDLFRSSNNRSETAKKIKLQFFDENISLLYPDNTLFPSNDLYPIDLKPFLVVEKQQIVSESFTITESLCDSENIVFGECNASKLEITVADVTLDVINKEFLATVTVGEYEIALGIYRVESFVRQADRRMRKITAYDRMRYFNRDVAQWYHDLTFPISLKKFRGSLCSYIGIEQVLQELPLDDLILAKTIEPSQLLALDVLTAICEINGRFGQIERTGKLKYIGLGISSLFPSNTLFPREDIYPSEIYAAETLSRYKASETTYEDYLVEGINGLQIRQEEGDVGASVGNGTNAYIIQGNFLVYGKSSAELLQIAYTTYEEIKERVYRPAKIAGPALPWVEVGDGLKCYTSDDVIETYCFKRSIKGIQAMTDTYEATGNESREESFGIGTKIIQIEGKAAIIEKTVEEVSVTVSDVKKQTEAQIKVLSDSISLKVDVGTVSTQLSLEKDKITLSGNRIIINSTNFKLDANGNATFSGAIMGGTIDVAGGKFKVDASGNITIKGATIDGTANTSSIGANLINTNLLNVQEQAEIWQCNIPNYLSCGYGDFDRINFPSYESSSDRRLKHDIDYLKNSLSYKIIAGLKPTAFTFNDSGSRCMGFIAQDVKELIDREKIELPLYHKNGEYYTIPYQNYIPLLVGAVQEMQKEIKLLKGGKV